MIGQGADPSESTRSRGLPLILLVQQRRLPLTPLLYNNSSHVRLQYLSICISLYDVYLRSELHLGTTLSLPNYRVRHNALTIRKPTMHLRVALPILSFAQSSFKNDRPPSHALLIDQGQAHITLRPHLQGLVDLGQAPLNLAPK